MVEVKYWMFNVVVDKTVDSNIVRRSIARFFGKWIHLSRSPNPSAYNVLITQDCADTGIVSINTVKVCLTRQTEFNIAKAIEYGRAYLRQILSWNKNTYTLASDENPPEKYEIHPAFDVYIWESKHMDWLLNSLEIKTGGNPLIHKRFGGEHYIYSGPRIAGLLKISDDNIDIHAEQLSSQLYNNDLDEFVETNKRVIEKYVEISRKFLESLREPDRVIISFSGGKDSLVVLDLALKHYGKEIVEAIYVDTGVGFPITHEYIDLVEEYYGITIRRVRARVAENIARHGFPTRSNRWCTILKSRAFKKEVLKIKKKHKKILVLVGDRDTESEARARKPPVRKRGEYLEAAPIKQWATLHVQLYIWINKLPMNPLYTMGFYRLGCYICPALTSLERFIMIKRLRETLNNKPWFKKYIDAVIGR